MNPYLDNLKAYPFERLTALTQSVSPRADKQPIVMSIGEPRYPTPQFIRDELTNNLVGLSRYPATGGIPELRTAIAQWLTWRFALKPGSLTAEHHVLPVNGSREALFAFAQCITSPPGSHPGSAGASKPGGVIAEPEARIVPKVALRRFAPKPSASTHQDPTGARSVDSASLPGSAGILPASDPGSAYVPSASTHQDPTGAGSVDSASLPGSAGILPASDPGGAGFQPASDRQVKDLVLMPNPFYQIYEGAAYLAGLTPYFINTNATTLLPDFQSVPEEIWQRCQLLYACSPGNPTGAVFQIHDWSALLALADKHDFIIASDECYSEIYFDESRPPIGLLQACAKLDRHDYKRCIVFNSLSKRSSVPGLRSGLVAGDAQIIEKFLLYRTYHGSAMAPPTQAASLKAWQDEAHVIAAREAYRQNFATFSQILSPVIDVKIPEGAFYVWLKTPIDDQQFTRELYRQQNLMVLPGTFISRQAHGEDPGTGYVRIALVGSIAETIDAATRLKEFLLGLKSGVNVSGEALKDQNLHRSTSQQ